MNSQRTKAIFVLSATLFLLVGLSLDAKGDTGLRAGASIADITPHVGVSLDGPISKNGPVKAIHDRLHARALVLSDGTTQLAIVVCDACMIGRDVFDAAKEIVHRRTGLPITHMLMSATHTHAAPRATHIGTSELDNAYHLFLAQRIAESVIHAQTNLAPAQIGWTSFRKPDFIRCRRSLCEPGSVGANPFGDLGERIKSVSGKSTRVIEPAGPVDPQFSVLSVQHIDGKPLAVMGNFSVHYCGGYQRGLVSADYFGHFATALEVDLHAGDDHPPFVGMMSNGTSGNTGAIERGGKSYPPFEWMKVSARILADETLRKLKTVEYRRKTPLATPSFRMRSSPPIRSASVASAWASSGGGTSRKSSSSKSARSSSRALVGCSASASTTSSIQRSRRCSGAGAGSFTTGPRRSWMRCSTRSSTSQ